MRDHHWPPNDGRRLHRTYTVPDVKDHASVAKASVRFGVDGSILSSYGVSSIDDDGTGDFGVNFLQALSTSKPRAHPAAIAGGAVRVAMIDGESANSVEVTIVDQTGASKDPSGCSVTVFG